MGFFDFLQPKKPKHELKWKLPEARLSLPVEDAEQMVYALKKNKARFASGGEFADVIHAKKYAENVYAYFLVRTEKKTEKETIVADPYMLREEDTLGTEVQSSYSMIEDLEKMGYKEVFARQVTEWRFTYGLLRVAVFQIEDFASFIEIALPATKIESARELQEKQAFALVEKLGFKKEDAIPLDVITIQMLESQSGGSLG